VIFWAKRALRRVPQGGGLCLAAPGNLGGIVAAAVAVLDFTGFHHGGRRGPFNCVICAEGPVSAPDQFNIFLVSHLGHLRQFGRATPERLKGIPGQGVVDGAKKGPAQLLLDRPNLGTTAVRGTAVRGAAT
jgi:hypothetical protein